MSWNPWEEFKENAPPLPIFEPPCRHCKYFKPVREYHRGSFIGVTICHTPKEMEHDFSCFEEKKEKQK